MAFDAEPLQVEKMVADRLSSSNHSENNRRVPNFSSAKSRRLPGRLNRRDLLLVEELSVIGEAFEEFSSIGSSSTTNRQALTSSAFLVNSRDDRDHIYGPGTNQQLTPCPLTTEVVWSPEENTRTAHAKGVNSITRWDFNKPVRANIEGFRTQASTGSVVNKPTALENEEEEDCVGEWSRKTKEECGEYDESLRGAITSWRKEKRGCSCSLYQSSTVFRGSIFVCAALLFCSIALLGITIHVRNKGNQQQHNGSASSIRSHSTPPPSTWSDISPTTIPTMYPSEYPSNVPSSIPTGALSNSLSGAPSLLRPTHTTSSILPASEPTQIPSIVPSSNSLAAPSRVLSGMPSTSILGVPSLGDQSIPPTKPSPFLPTTTDIFIGPAPPEVNWPF